MLDTLVIIPFLFAWTGFFVGVWCSWQSVSRKHTVASKTTPFSQCNIIAAGLVFAVLGFFVGLIVDIFVGLVMLGSNHIL